MFSWMSRHFPAVRLIQRSEARLHISIQSALSESGDQSLPLQIMFAWVQESLWLAAQ
jgi:hypothetical protein